MIIIRLVYQYPHDHYGQRDRGRRGRWSTEDCGFCSSQRRKIAVPLVGHVTTGTAAEPGSVLAGVWWNRTLTQMTGPDAFHLDGESEALVRDKCTVRGHKSTSYDRGVDTHGWKGKEIFYLKHPHGRKTLDRLQRSRWARCLLQLDGQTNTNIRTRCV